MAYFRNAFQHSQYQKQRDLNSMEKKVLRWNFVFQYGWVLTNMFNSILLLPLYVKNIDSATLGVWLATSSVLNWMTLADPGVGEVLQQNIAEFLGRKQYDEIGRSIGSGFIASGIIVLIAILFGFGCFFSIGHIINKDVSQYPHLASALMISIVATGMSLVSFTLSGINQGLHNAANVAISSLAANFMFLFVNLAFLFMGFGVMSIAIANLARALFINGFNIVSMLKLLKREHIPIVYEKTHFKRFIKIFSFTSASKIISGLSYSVDMLVLARFIPPGMITVYEINKRPINLSTTLVGRHSVALMPLVSHAVGTGNKELIVELIYKQFKFYSYASIFLCLVFVLTYFNLISLWTGPDKYIGNAMENGNLILYLLIIFNFLNLITYFMSNMGYALGDIKKNSQFNIVRNLIYGVLLYFAARYYGILGTVVIAMVTMLVADFFYFPYKVYRMGYFSGAMVRKSLILWAIIIPVSLLVIWGCWEVTDHLLGPTMYFSKLMVDSAVFTIFFLSFLLMIDKEVRQMAGEWKAKLLNLLSSRKLKAAETSN